MLKNLLSIHRPEITDALDIANSTNMMLDIVTVVRVALSPIAS